MVHGVDFVFLPQARNIESYLCPPNSTAISPVKRPGYLFNDHVPVGAFRGNDEEPPEEPNPRKAQSMGMKVNSRMQDTAFVYQRLSR